MMIGEFADKKIDMAKSPLWSSNGTGGASCVTTYQVDFKLEALGQRYARMCDPMRRDKDLGVRGHTKSNRPTR
jgi:hypothetical protein